MVRIAFQDNRDGSMWIITIKPNHNRIKPQSLVHSDGNMKEGGRSCDKHTLNDGYEHFDQDPSVTDQPS